MNTLSELRSLLLMTGLREWFAQTDERSAHPRIPVMVNMASASVSSKKNQNLQDSLIHPSSSLDQLNAGSRHSVMMDEYSDEDEEFQLAESEQEVWFTLESSSFSSKLLSQLLS